MAGTCHLSVGASVSAPLSSRHFSRIYTLNPSSVPNSKSTKITPRFIVRRAGSLEIHAMTASFGSRLEESVKKTITDNPVVVYSKTWCSYSSEVKTLFNRLGVQPFVVELDELGPQGPQLQKVLERLTGQHTVPNVFIDTIKLHRKGELESMLAEASAGKTQT